MPTKKKSQGHLDGRETRRAAPPGAPRGGAHPPRPPPRRPPPPRPARGGAPGGGPPPRGGPARRRSPCRYRSRGGALEDLAGRVGAALLAEQLADAAEHGGLPLAALDRLEVVVQGVVGPVLQLVEARLQ